MPITIPSELTKEFVEFIESKVANFNTDYYIYCDFCGEHNRPYRTDLVHKPDCLGEKLIQLAINSEDD